MLLCRRYVPRQGVVLSGRVLCAFQAIVQLQCYLTASQLGRKVYHTSNAPTHQMHLTRHGEFSYFHNNTGLSVSFRNVPCPNRSIIMVSRPRELPRAPRITALVMHFA